MKIKVTVKRCTAPNMSCRGHKPNARSFAELKVKFEEKISEYSGKSGNRPAPIEAEQVVEKPGTPIKSKDGFIYYRRDYPISLSDDSKHSMVCKEEAIVAMEYLCKHFKTMKSISKIKDLRISEIIALYKEKGNIL